MKQTLLAICLALFITSSALAEAQTRAAAKTMPHEGVIIKVISAGKLVVWEKDKLYPFTLYGIDLPNPDSAQGIEAKKTVSKLVFNKLLTVEIIQKEQTLGIVMIRGKCLNETLVRQGIARVSKDCNQEPHCSQWAKVQKE